jgi:hypothetical protein
MTTLTPEQRAAIPAHVKRWIDIGLWTKPMDRKRATEAVLRCYELAGLPAPRIEFVRSFRTPPDISADIQDDFHYAILYAVRSVVWRAVWDAVENEVWNEVSKVRDEVWNAVKDAVWAADWVVALSGQYDASSCALWHYCMDVFGIKLSDDVCCRLDAWCALVEACGGVYWGSDVATIVDRPEAFERDSDGRITAVVFRNGWKVQV